MDKMFEVLEELTEEEMTETMDEYFELEQTEEVQQHIREEHVREMDEAAFKVAGSSAPPGIESEDTSDDDDNVKANKGAASLSDELVCKEIINFMAAQIGLLQGNPMLDGVTAKGEEFVFFMSTAYYVNGDEQS